MKAFSLSPSFTAAIRVYVKIDITNLEYVSLIANKTIFSVNHLLSYKKNILNNENDVNYSDIYVILLILLLLN